MPQTIVNFLTQATVGGTLTTSARVFDYEIGSVEKLIYQHLMEDLQAAITGSNASKIKQILMELNKWSQIKVSTGTEVVTDSTKTISDLKTTPLTKLTEVTTMNRYMAEDVDKIIRTFRSAGWDPIITASSDNSASAALALINLPANADIYPVSKWIAEGLNAAGGAVLNTGVRDIEGTSLQQMLMVDYVSHGNDLLFNEMSSLSTAISNNQDALSYLNSLQDLMNQKDPKTFLLALNQLSGISSTNTAAYTAFEKASFDQELGTTAKFTANQIASYLTQLNSPNYTVDITTLSANVQSLATKLVPVTLVQVLASVASQYPASLAGNAALLYFQTGLTAFMNDFTTFQTRVGELQALDIGNNSISTLETRVSNLKSALQTFDITFNDLGFKISNLQQAAGVGTEYATKLRSAWAAMSSIPFGVEGGPLSHFGTTISAIETQISTMKTSLINVNAYARDLNPYTLKAYAEAIYNKSEATAFWGTWGSERDSIYKRMWGHDRDGFSNPRTGVDGSTTELSQAQVNFTYAYNNGNGTPTLNQLATLSDELAGKSSQLYNILYYDDGIRGTYGVGPYGLVVYADKSFYWRNNGDKYTPSSTNPEMINLLAAINDAYNATEKTTLSDCTSWAAQGREDVKVLYYNGTPTKNAIVTKGTDIIGTISPASPGYIGGSFDTLRALIANWSTTSATKASFLDTYATFQSQIATFAAKKTAYVAQVNASTEPSTALINAGLDLVTAIENLDATYRTLHANVTAAFNETSGDLHNSIGTASGQAFETNMTSKTPAEWTTTLAAVKSDLSKLTESSGSATGAFVNLNDATKTFNTNKERIITNLTYLLEQLGITSGATSLTSSLETLKKDFTDVADIAVWVQDYATAQQGSYQTHLNNAIVASQSLNDAKREELRQVMFVFEEFYKSSTSMLSRLTQLIEKMASAINR